MAIVSVENLKMSYDKGRVKALKGVTFDVEEGEIFGLIALTEPARPPCSVFSQPCSLQIPAKLWSMAWTW